MQVELEKRLLGISSGREAKVLGYFLLFFSFLVPRYVMCLRGLTIAATLADQFCAVLAEGQPHTVIFPTNLRGFEPGQLQ
jgi:hypothetical protein